MDFWSNGKRVSADKNSGVTVKQVESTKIDRATGEKAAKSYLKEGGFNLELLNKDFLFYAEKDTTLEFYPIYTDTDQTYHKLGVFYYDENGEYHEMVAWENMNSYALYSQTNDVVTSKGIAITIKKGWKFGFYWSGKAAGFQEGWGNTGSYQSSYRTNVTYYSKASLNEGLQATPDGIQYDQWKNAEKIQTHAGTFTVDGHTYLCIEDWTDYDYQDVVFMFNMEVKTSKGDDTKPAVIPDPEPEPTPQPQPTPEDPTDPAVKAIGASIEANLAINDPKEIGDWVESHLSIHVRDTSDVTVFLPVPAQYYCPEDDMMIVLKHDTLYTYNEETETTSMDINGNRVTLTVTYGEKGITIQTSGINADVLKYLRKEYEDGLTFEIRNYYNSSVKRDALKAMLDQATITFTNPTKTYVNAKGFDVDDKGNVTTTEDALSCTVTPTDIANRTAPTEATKSELEEANLYIYPLK